MDTTTSIGINKWAAGFTIARIGEIGEGDRRLIAWIRSDGARAIESNGDPLFDYQSGFEEAWEGIEAGMGLRPSPFPLTSRRASFAGCAFFVVRPGRRATGDGRKPIPTNPLQF